MYRVFILVAAVVMLLGGCREGLHHDDSATEAHEATKVQYISYSDRFELFAEADPLVAGKKANILSHFSVLPEFKPLESSVVTIILEAGGSVTRQTLDQPVRKGIYSFDITPATAGKGDLKFEISNGSETNVVIVPEIMVYPNQQEAEVAAGHDVHSKVNATVFTKEQSWKIDFATEYPQFHPFGQVIRTTGQVQPVPANDLIVTAGASGVISLAGAPLFEGTEVAPGQVMFSISGKDFAEGNFSVMFLEAKNNYEKAKADYERSKILAEDKIVSEKDLLIARNQFENAKAIYDNLSGNFNASGQVVKSPVSGFIRQLNVQNGSYVTAGQPLMIISQNKTLMIHAELPVKYASLLASVKSANIIDSQLDRTWMLEELGGRVLSFGKAAEPGGYLLPLNLEIQNDGSFVAGEVVGLYLKAMGSDPKLTVPNSALLEEQGTFFVWVQITPELFEKRGITTGATDGMETEVLQGLTAEDRIVTKGAIMIKLAQATGTLDAHSGHVH